jgi:UDPglucose 6-dehydrogenase
MAAKIINACGGDVTGKTVAVLGVTFKPNTDDMRDSPSLDIIPALQAAGATIRAYDPEGMEEARPMLPDVAWCENAYATIEGADAVTLLTEWNEFRGLDLARVKALLRKPVMIDLRNVYNPEEMVAAGFAYCCVGRNSVGMEILA